MTTLFQLVFVNNTSEQTSINLCGIFSTTKKAESYAKQLCGDMKVREFDDDEELLFMKDHNKTDLVSLVSNGFKVRNESNYSCFQIMELNVDPALSSTKIST
jgi:hypothetical protein